ncbi:phosphoglycerate kinase [Dunaliella salina]|uniref:Phosphoglycerate kinase n=1 Tax=Dunaliella salina TaxID=3046 RepID=A0ABQ7G6U6_DUNSA|nr:phosphoglycerate kinase [Dunaliella salina]|eukprot:KAF5830330.1 phosphoglycerate kinase [Dunaliella salina]
MPQVCLLENTRFHAGDTKNDPAFAAAFGKLAHVFVCDAFGVVHRDQGSITGVTQHVEASYPGPLIRHELTYLSQYLEEPKRPLGVVMGGSKVADKIGVLWALIKKADVLLIGGRMAFTFLAAKGVCVGATQVEEAWLQPALEMLAAAEARGVKLLLPCDVLVSNSLEAPQKEHIVELGVNCCVPEAPCVPAGQFGVDIGPSSNALFTKALAQCGTIFWNGPMGKFEVPAFALGTQAVARAVADATKSGAVTVVGGGDSVAAISQMGLASHVSHISTGGGASLEFVEGKGMPGLRALAAVKPLDGPQG